MMDELSFTYSKKNFTSLDRAESPTVILDNMPWNLLIQKRYSKENANTYLSFFLKTGPLQWESSWSCYVEASLIILPKKKNLKKFVRDIQHSFTPEEFDWGYSHFHEWKLLINPEYGYIENDTVSFQVLIKASNPVGIHWHFAGVQGPDMQKDDGVSNVMEEIKNPIDERKQKFVEEVTETLQKFIEKRNSEENVEGEETESVIENESEQPEENEGAEDYEQNEEESRSEESESIGIEEKTVEKNEKLDDEEFCEVNTENNEINGETVDNFTDNLTKLIREQIEIFFEEKVKESNINFENNSNRKEMNFHPFSNLPLKHNRLNMHDPPECCIAYHSPSFDVNWRHCICNKCFSPWCGYAPPSKVECDQFKLFPRDKCRNGEKIRIPPLFDSGAHFFENKPEQFSDRDGDDSSITRKIQNGAEWKFPTDEKTSQKDNFETEVTFENKFLFIGMDDEGKFVSHKPKSVAELYSLMQKYKSPEVLEIN